MTVNAARRAKELLNADPPEINGARIDHAVISDGCIITNADVHQSIVGLRSVFDGNVKGPPRNLQRRSVAEKPLNRARVDRRRHNDETQIGSPPEL